MLRDLLPRDFIAGTFLEHKIFENSIADYLIFIALFIVSTTLIKLIRKGVLAVSQKFADKYNSELPGFIIIKLKKLFVPLEYFGVFYFSIKALTLHPYIMKTLDVLGLLIVVFYSVRFIIAVVDFILEQKMARADSPGKTQVFRSILPAVNITIWGIGLVFVLSNLGFNISALVTGLGIGGIAIALAAQSMLGDVFSYLSILADKPFEIGDLINVDGIAGRVAYIGIKTTRLTSVTGEQLIFSNSNLTSSRIRNFEKTETRRGEITIGVVYETPATVLEEIPQIIKSIVENTEYVRLERSHFQDFGDFSLIFQTVFWVDGGEYVDFMDKQQHILIEIFKEFERREIEFAYPTQKLYMARNIEKKLE